MIIVDTNVVASLLFDDGASTLVARQVYLRDHSWAIPVLLRSELRNVCWKHVRRGRIDLDQAQALELSADRLLRGSEFTVSGSRVLSLAASSGCTAYDCEFVALAESLDVPLVTWDRAVLVAFAGVAMTPEHFVGAGESW